MRRTFLYLIMVLALPIEAASAELSADAYEPYTRRGYEKTFAKWGQAGIKKVNEYRKKAAIAASQSAKCDKVDYAELSDNRSSPPAKIVIFVDCSNGQRFYISNEELDRQKAAVSVQSKTADIKDSDLISACESSIRHSLKFPSSFDKSWFSSNVYRAPQGNVVVTFDFTAKNGFGMDLLQQARCVTDDRGLHPPEIYNR